MAKTPVIIDDKLLNGAMKASGAKTGTERKVNGDRDGQV
jgi:hypothetical protein